MFKPWAAVKQEVLGRTGYCATVETKYQKAGRGLTSCSTLHINWKGMKCQACFHHSETVKTLPPPPPTNQSPLKPSPPHHPHASHSQQPPTAMTKLFSSLPRFALPDKNLQRSLESVRSTLSLPCLLLPLCHHEENRSSFCQLGLCMCLLARCKQLPAK